MSSVTAFSSPSTHGVGIVGDQLSFHQGEQTLLQDDADGVGFAGDDGRHLVDFVDADGRPFHRSLELLGVGFSPDQGPCPLLHRGEQPLGLELHALGVDQQVGIDDRHRPKRLVLGYLVIQPLDVVHDRGLAGTGVSDQEDVSGHLAGSVFVDRHRDEPESRVLTEHSLAQLVEDLRRGVMLLRS